MHSQSHFTFCYIFILLMTKYVKRVLKLFMLLFAECGIAVKAFEFTSSSVEDDRWQVCCCGNSPDNIHSSHTFDQNRISHCVLHIYYQRVHQCKVKWTPFNCYMKAQRNHLCAGRHQTGRIRYLDINFYINFDTFKIFPSRIRDLHINS